MSGVVKHVLLFTAKIFANEKFSYVVAAVVCPCEETVIDRT